MEHTSGALTAYPEGFILYSLSEYEPRMKSSHPDPLSPEFPLLGLLSLRPGHGYGLHQQLRAQLGHIWKISQSQAYSVLKRLEEKGYISLTRSTENQTTTQELAITPSGREYFEGWLALVSPATARGIRLGFFTRLFFLQQLSPAALPAAIRDQLSAISRQKERLALALRDLSPGPGSSLDPNLLSLELRLEQLTAMEGWMSQKLAHPTESLPE